MNKVEVKIGEKKSEFGCPFLPKTLQYPDLANTRLGRKIFLSRWFQPLLIFINLAVFVVLITAGFIGIQVGNHNATIILIWIFWFFLLIALFIPIGGRLWCLMCPLPALGEWVSRGAIIRKSKRTFNFGVRWPKFLDNIWLQNIGFLLVALFSPIILTRPWATSWLLILFIILALGLSLVFKYQNKIGRIFCKYVCPVGGFIGLYSLIGAVEVKTKDPQVCKAHKTKDCITGTENGWGCPWFQVVPNMERNLYCGLCTECIKSCPYSNLAFRLRPFAADLLKVRKLDEAFKSFIMIGSGLMFLTVFFGWWGFWKNVGDPLSGIFPQGPFEWQNLLIYGSVLWTVAFGVIPGLTLITALVSRYISQSNFSLKRLFIDYGYALVPLGLAAWIGFMVSMILINGSYIVSVISDPFGWGWNLFGTADYKWRPYFPELVPYLSSLIIFLGALGSLFTARRLHREDLGSDSLLGLLPFQLLITILGFAFIYLLTGGM